MDALRELFATDAYQHFASTVTGPVRWYCVVTLLVLLVCIVVYELLALPFRGIAVLVQQSSKT
jgi:hypothetical protein